MELTVFLAAFLLLLQPALAGVNPDIYCMDGVRAALQQFALGDSALLTYYENMCQYNLTVISLWATGKTYCTPKEIEVGGKFFGEQCLEYGGVELVPYSEILPLLTDEYIASLPLLGLEDIDPTEIWTTPILLTKHLWSLAVRSSTEYDRQYTLHKRYGWAVYGFWGGFLVIGMANRLISHFYNSRRSHGATDVEGLEDLPSSSGKSSIILAPIKATNHWIRANLIIPAAFGSHHQRLYWWCSIPTRMETVVVSLFWILNFVLCAISYGIFKDNLYYSVAVQYWRYISDRTGIISYANLPLIWMFSGRNNVFLWLTGWSFSSFNIFHRHIARIATIQAIIHSVGWSAIQINAGYFQATWKQEYWYMGAMATITMSLLLGFSSIYLRLRHYEFFLIIHIVLSILTLVGLFYHTWVFTNKEYDPYLWPCVIIWAVDRFARLVRLGYCNFRVRRSGGPVFSTATATYNKAADLIRVEVFPGSRLLRPGPGQHYYIYQLNKFRFWENHPFTLAASYPSAHDTAEHDAASPTPSDTGSLVVVAQEKETEVTESALLSGSGSTSPAPASTSSLDSPAKERPLGPSEPPAPTAPLVPTEGSKLVFFIRPFNSWTKRLRDECTRAGPAGLTKSSLRIEGPYGHHSPLLAFENVIFIVGGTGIAGAIPHLQEHLRRSSDQASGAKGTRTRSISVIWAAKQSAMFHDILSHELKPFLGRDDINFSLHATRESKQSSPTKASQLDNKAPPSQEFNIQNTRPDIKTSILNVVGQVNAAGSRGGRIAILTCGPGAMADEARAAVHQALKNGKRGLEYFEEAFGW